MIRIFMILWFILFTLTLINIVIMIIYLSAGRKMYKNLNDDTAQYYIKCLSRIPVNNHPYFLSKIRDDFYYVNNSDIISANIKKELQITALRKGCNLENEIIHENSDKGRKEDKVNCGVNNKHNLRFSWQVVFSIIIGCVVFFAGLGILYNINRIYEKINNINTTQNSDNTENQGE